MTRDEFLLLYTWTTDPEAAPEVIRDLDALLTAAERRGAERMREAAGSRLRELAGVAQEASQTLGATFDEQLNALQRARALRYGATAIEALPLEAGSEEGQAGTEDAPAFASTLQAEVRAVVKDARYYQQHPEKWGQIPCDLRKRLAALVEAWGEQGEEKADGPQG